MIYNTKEEAETELARVKFVIRGNGMGFLVSLRNIDTLIDTKNIGTEGPRIPNKYTIIETAMRAYDRFSDAQNAIKLFINSQEFLYNDKGEEVYE